MTTAAGREIWRPDTCQPICEDDRVTKLQGTIQDISHLKRSEEQFGVFGPSRPLDRLGEPQPLPCALGAVSATRRAQRHAGRAAVPGSGPFQVRQRQPRSFGRRPAARTGRRDTRRAGALLRHHRPSRRGRVRGHHGRCRQAACGPVRAASARGTGPAVRDETREPTSQPASGSASIRRTARTWIPCCAMPISPCIGPRRTAATASISRARHVGRRRGAAAHGARAARGLGAQRDDAPLPAAGRLERLQPARRGGALPLAASAFGDWSPRISSSPWPRTAA